MELNSKQQEFCRLVVSGVKKGEAYTKAFQTKGDNKRSDSVQASTLLKNPNILAYIKELQRRADEGAIMSRRQRMEWLSKMAEASGESGSIRDGVACIAELNKMDGAHEPEKVQVLGLGVIAQVLSQGDNQPLISE